MKRSGLLLGIAIASTLALAACDSATGSPSASPSVSAASASPSASASASPSPTPSPSATFVAHPDVADLYLTTSGLLPLTLGLPPATNPGAAMIVFDPAACAGLDLGLTPAEEGRWKSTYPDGTFALDAGDTEVVWIEAGPDITTPEGIGIGSTLSELQATYPALVAGTGGITSHVWWIQDPHGTVVFETQNAATDGSVPAVGSDTVVLMRALSHAWGSYIDWGAANSGNVPGACF